MHTHIGVPPSVGSLATNIQGRLSPSATKMQRWIASLGKKAKKGMVASLSANWIHDAISAIAVLGGAVAFGFWRDSISAGLFACFALFLMAGIYKALQQIGFVLSDRIRAGNWPSTSSGTGCTCCTHLLRRVFSDH